MARGKRTSEEAKIRVAQRVAKGEDVSEIAKELGVSEYTIGDWARQFKPKPRKVKRKVAIKQPTENTRVSELEAEVRKLRGLVEFWKSAYDTTVTNGK